MKTVFTSVRLSEACEKITDGSHRTPAFMDEGPPFVTVAHVGKDGQIDFSACGHISSQDYEDLVKNDCRPRLGDVLFSKDGTVGKVSVIDFDKDFVVLSSLAILRPNLCRVNQRYLAYVLRWDETISQATSRKSGSAIRRIILRDLANVRIPLPPLSEQERIVRILDEAEALRKLRAQADHRTADLIPALFHDMFGDTCKKKPHPVQPLSEAAEVVSGVAKGRHFNGQTPVTVPYIRVANVQAGYLDLSKIKNIEALPSEVEELELKRGDVLLTEGGDFDKLGRGAMWEHEIPNCIHQNHIFRVRVDQSKLLPIYFEKFLQTLSAKTYFLGCAKRTTNLASINMTQLRALPVPIPPLELQREFAAHVEEVRAMKAQQAKSRRRLDDLFHSLLHRAFGGEL